MEGNEDLRFRTAVHSTHRIVKQCRSHVEKTLGKVKHYGETASKESPFMQERTTQDRVVQEALSIRLDHVENTSNALLQYLHGLQVLLEDDDNLFLPLPMKNIARGIAEVSASCCWLISPEQSLMERAVRGWAAAFYSLERSIEARSLHDRAQLVALRELLVERAEDVGLHAQRRVKDGRTYDDVSVVTMGRVHAKVRFSYSTRIAQEIPGLTGMYSPLSAVVHGETPAIAMTYAEPDVSARSIAVAAKLSTEAWSKAIHAWYAVEPGPFINPNDFARLLSTISAGRRAEFEELKAMQTE